MLSVRGLAHGYGGKLALAGLDLEVQAGQIVGLLGPNGAGKSTCFRAIAGLLVPDRGTVTLDGRAVGDLPLWRRVQSGLGYLAQEPSVFRQMSALDNIRVALEGVGEAGSAHDWLERVGLEAQSGVAAGRLSGGERRRLELGRALATRPKVLLLDEPFAGVDPIGVADLKLRLQRLAQEGLAVLLTDHAVRDALPMCHLAVLLDAGHELCRGSPQAVAADPIARARYLGEGFDLE